MLFSIFFFVSTYVNCHHIFIFIFYEWSDLIRLFLLSSSTATYILITILLFFHQIERQCVLRIGSDQQFNHIYTLERLSWIGRSDGNNHRKEDKKNVITHQSISESEMTTTCMYIWVHSFLYQRLIFIVCLFSFVFFFSCWINGARNVPNSYAHNSEQYLCFIARLPIHSHVN